MNNIRRIRLENELQQKQVAAELGVSQGTVSEWESGKSKPTPDNLIKLAQLFSCTVDRLLGIENKASAPVNKEKPAINEYDGLTDEQIEAIEKIKNLKSIKSHQRAIDYLGLLENQDID